MNLAHRLERSPGQAWRRFVVTQVADTHQEMFPELDEAALLRPVRVQNLKGN
jgi:hypothetical protein